MYTLPCALHLDCKHLTWTYCILDVLWENNSNYVSCSLEDFISYASNTGSGVEGDGNCRQKLLDKRRHKWAYADYKHMHELFESQVSKSLLIQKV